MITDKNRAQLKEFISEEKIQNRILEIAKEINAIFPKEEELVVVAVLAGSILFASDLVKRLGHGCAA